MVANEYERGDISLQQGNYAALKLAARHESEYSSIPAQRSDHSAYSFATLASEYERGDVASK